MSTSYDVYVANIPEAYTEKEVKDIFDVAGDIVGVKVLTPKQNNKNKVAFVKFLEEEDAKCAAQYMNNHLLDNGVSLTVRYKPQEGNSGYESKSELKPVENEITNGAQSELINVLTIHIESPIQFWAQKLDEDVVQKVQDFTDQMEKLCPLQPKVVGQLSTQQIYASKFSVDGMWYRCRVEKCLAKNMVHIRYIDYGNWEVVERFALVTLPMSLTSQSPFASCYQISNLDLVDSNLQSELNSKGIKLLTDLISDQLIDLKVLKTENQVNYVKVYQLHENESLLDIPAKLMLTGCVKLKTTVNKERERTPVKNKPNGRQMSSAVNGVKGSPIPLPVTIQNTLMTQIYKDKVDIYAKEVEEKQQEIESLKRQLEDNRSQCQLLLEQAITTKFSKLLSNVSELRKVRSTLPGGGNVFPSEIQSKVDLLLHSPNIINLSTMKQFQSLLVSESNLKEQQKVIATSPNKEQLFDIIESRDKALKKCLRDIKSFVKHIGLLPLDVREAELNDALKNIDIDKEVLKAMEFDRDLSLEKAINTYESDKSNKGLAMHKLQQAANEESNNLFKAIGQIQHECHCVVSEAKGCVEENIDSLMKQYEYAIKEEIDSAKSFEVELTSASSLQTVLAALWNSLRCEIDDIKRVRNNLLPEYEKLQTKYEDILQDKPDVTCVLQARKKIKSLKSKFRHQLADIVDIEEDSEENDADNLKELEMELQNIRLDLHKQFIKEQNAMKVLATTISTFPELQVQYPELKLEEFQNSNGLLQTGRFLEHYSHTDLPILASQKKQITYRTSFNGQPCVLKEIIIDDKSIIYNDHLSRLVEFSHTPSQSRINIECLFSGKNNRKLYIHLPYMEEGNLKEFLEIRKPSKNVIQNILKDVLIALSKQETPYCSLKPENVLIKKMDKGYCGILADPNVIETQERRLNACLFLHKTIPGYPVLDMFQEQPSHKADMVCFGGIVLWALHQDSTFSKNIHSDLELIVQDSSMKDLLQHVLNPTLSERMDAKTSLCHEYFASLVKEEVIDVEETELLMLLQKHDDVIDDTKAPNGLSNGYLSFDDHSRSDDDAESNVQDAWNDALNKKKNSIKRFIREEKPEDVSITDDDF